MLAGPKPETVQSLEAAFVKFDEKCPFWEKIDANLAIYLANLLKTMFLFNFPNLDFVELNL